VRVGSVATRYANALFELAREHGALDAVQRDVDAIAALLAADAKSAWLFDARVGQDEKRAKLERLAAGLHRYTGNLVRLLGDKRRLEVLRELPAAFKRRALAERGAVEGVVESPRPLQAGEVAELQVALGALLKKEVLLEARTAPELLAGARIVVDNRMIDSSAQGRLEALRARLIAAPLTPLAVGGSPSA
jgi:F-type H+-transporting ATPase subunit delta